VEVVVNRANFLTVEEAGRVLRIGRTAAYEAAKRFRSSGGTDGIPVVAVGGSLRVPVARLEQWAGGPLDLSVLDGLAAARDELRTVEDHPATTPRTRPARGTTSRKAQTSLPFSD